MESALYLQRVCINPAPDWYPSSGPGLSRREFEILGLIVAGYTTREVAEYLHVDVETVNTHRKRMIKKYKARNMIQVIIACIARNKLSLEILQQIYMMKEPEEIRYLQPY